jgi:hypothetical protein
VVFRWAFVMSPCLISRRGNNACHPPTFPILLYSVRYILCRTACMLRKDRRHWHDVLRLYHELTTNIHLTRTSQGFYYDVVLRKRLLARYLRLCHDVIVIATAAEAKEGRRLRFGIDIGSKTMPSHEVSRANHELSRAQHEHNTNTTRTQNEHNTSTTRAQQDIPQIVDDTPKMYPLSTTNHDLSRSITS